MVIGTPAFAVTVAGMIRYSVSDNFTIGPPDSADEAAVDAAVANVAVAGPLETEAPGGAPVKPPVMPAPPLQAELARTIAAPSAPRSHAVRRCCAAGDVGSSPLT